MLKKLLSVVLAIVMVLSIGTVAMVSVSAELADLPKVAADCNRYFFYLPDYWKNDYAYTAGIYWWEGTGAHSSWPGQEADEADHPGVFYCDVPQDVTTVIWNNFLDGGTDKSLPIYQAAIQTVNIGTEYYDPGESDNYPDGTDSFDGMIYVTDNEKIDINPFSGKMTVGGEWYYYYGNGEYGFTPVRGDGEIFTAQASNMDTTLPEDTGAETTATPDTTEPTDTTNPTEPSDTNRYYFYLPDEWVNEYANTAGIYWWEGTDKQNAWPGAEANKGDADGVYYYDVPKDVPFVIWNNYIDGGSDPSQPIYDASSQTVTVGTEYYEKGESDLYPEGNTGFNNMIFVIDLTKVSVSTVENRVYDGEWYYYYGNGEYGITPDKADADVVYNQKTLVVPIDPEASEPVKVQTDEKTQISVETDTDADLTVKEIDSDQQIADIDLVLVGEKVGKLYDITLEKDGAEVQPDGTVTVKIPAVDVNSKVYRVEEDGTLTDMQAVYKDGFMVFTTEHFSLYVVTASEEEAEFDLGDANQDGVVNVKDATTIQKHVALLIELSEKAIELADYDNDGKISVRDATAIQKFIAGLI